jgi:hypothetical protein
MKQKINKNKTIILACVAVIIAAALVFAWHHHHKTPALTPASSGSASQNSGSNINYGPPTDTEKQETAAHKQQLSQTPSSTPSSGQKQVTPIITSASSTEVRAYVTGVFEDGGTCTATVTNGAQKHTFTSTGVANSNYTQCAPIELTSISGSGWSVVVSYSSSAASGQSASTPIR